MEKSENLLSIARFYRHNLKKIKTFIINAINSQNKIYYSLVIQKKMTKTNRS